MIRNYVRKMNRGKQYFQEILAEAVLEVQSGQMSAYKAAKGFNIPLNTVIDHVKGRRRRKSTSHGRPTALPLDVEKKIAACLITMEQYGFGLSRKDIVSLVGQKLPKKEFVKLLSTLWQELVPNIIKSGFLKGGIYPFNQDMIPEERFDKLCLQLWNHINRPHLQAGSSNEGSVVHESEVVQAGSSYEGSVVCSEVVSQCDSNPPVEKGRALHLLRKLQSSVVGSHQSVSRARARKSEELVSETIENHQSAEKKKKTSLAKGAEVITSDNVYARIRDQDKKKAEAEKRKLKNKKNS
ncbi:hypothetical protein PR048_001072 [Dryococelus australis]|uniref:HTH psq-type domain-containing protein n=1 Tax=Dryococelus australis TaxID=614101 RepID=A0ABQ9IHN1_9NEOP|nr:hypothetical protein PR048_001072 [Dryococelus australis]